MRMSALTIAGLALGLAVTGCDKKPKTAPTPAAENAAENTAEHSANKAATNVGGDKVAIKPAVADEAPAVSPTPPKAVAVEIKTDGDSDGTKDLAKIVLDIVDGWNAHKPGVLAAHMTDDAVMVMVGNPMMPEVKGKAAIAAFNTLRMASSTDAKVRARRVFEVGNQVIMQAGVLGTNDGPMGELKPTGKTFGVASVSVVDFNEAGQITRVTSYQDDATLMMQLGVFPPMPGMAVKPVPLAENVEIIKGQASIKGEATIKAWGEAFNKASYKAAFDTMAAANFTFADPNMAMNMTGREANVKYLDEMLFSMFPDWQGGYDSIVSVGDWIIARGNSAGTYAGGMPGVEAKGAKVTSHSLDIYKLDANGKIARLEMYSNGMEMMAQMGMMGGAGGDKPASKAPEDAPLRAR